jgi:hypothetical protein
MGLCATLRRLALPCSVPGVYGYTERRSETREERLGGIRIIAGNR